MNGPIVLYDGVCKFCDATVNFVIDHDRRGRIRFVAFQSATGQALLRRCGLPTDQVDSIVLIEGRHHWTRSTAVLRIARWLDGAWPLLILLLGAPAFLRDPLYDWFARNRYRWLGKLESCRVPTADVRRRFLE